MVASDIARRARRVGARRELHPARARSERAISLGRADARLGDQPGHPPVGPDRPARDLPGQGDRPRCDDDRRRPRSLAGRRRCRRGAGSPGSRSPRSACPCSPFRSHARVGISRWHRCCLLFLLLIVATAATGGPLLAIGDRGRRVPVRELLLHAAAAHRSRSNDTRTCSRLVVFLVVAGGRERVRRRGRAPAPQTVRVRTPMPRRWPGSRPTCSRTIRSPTSSCSCGRRSGSTARACSHVPTATWHTEASAGPAAAAARPKPPELTLAARRRRRAGAGGRPPEPAPTARC